MRDRCEPGSSRSTRPGSERQSLALRRAPLMRRIVSASGDARHRAAEATRRSPCSRPRSLAVVVTYPELLYQTENIAARTYETEPAVHHGELLVPAHDHGVDYWSVLRGALLRPRHLVRAPTHPIKKLRRNLTTLRSRALSQRLQRAGLRCLLRYPCEAVHKRYGCSKCSKGIHLEVARASDVPPRGRPGRASRPSFGCINHLEKINSGRLYVDGSLVGYQERGGRLTSFREREVCPPARTEMGWSSSVSTVPAT